MADIHGTADRAVPTITELANSSRIGRARFIGNAIGALLVMAAVTGLYMALGLAIGFRPPFYNVLAPKPGATLIVPSAMAALILSLLYLAIFIDLAIRRRHDRNRTGVDVIVWAEFAIAAHIGALFGPNDPALLAFDIPAALLGLWLLVALVFLPGTKGPNRYGEDPRELLRRAGH